MPDDEYNELAFWLWVVVIYISIILVLATIGRMVF